MVAFRKKVVDSGKDNVFAGFERLLRGGLGLTCWPANCMTWLHVFVQVAANRSHKKELHFLDDIEDTVLTCLQVQAFIPPRLKLPVLLWHILSYQHFSSHGVCIPWKHLYAL